MVDLAQNIKLDNVTPKKKIINYVFLKKGIAIFVKMWDNSNIKRNIPGIYFIHNCDCNYWL